MARKNAKTVAVDSVRHKDKRKNIPTEELRDFVAGDEAQPKTILYPRDPSLDPQLVWKGKDEQDQRDLAVPAVPVYIQEKIHPQALIEDLRAQAKKDRPEPQINLFADFNGLDDDFQKKVGFDLLVVCGFAFDAHAGETAKSSARRVHLPRKASSRRAQSNSASCRGCSHA